MSPGSASMYPEYLSTAFYEYLSNSLLNYSNFKFNGLILSISNYSLYKIPVYLSETFGS